MDLALAHVVARSWPPAGTELDAWQMRALTHGCRAAKEPLLARRRSRGRSPSSCPAAAASWIGGTIRTEMSREDVEPPLLDGFFPHVTPAARPLVAARARPDTAGPALRAVTRRSPATWPRSSAAACLRAILPTARRTALSTHGASCSTAACLKSPAHPRAHLLAIIRLAGRPKAARRRGVLARRTTSTWRWPAARPTTAWYGAATACASAAVRPAPTTSGVESAELAVPGRRRRRLQRAVRCCRSAWRRAASSTSPPSELGLVVGEPVCFRFFGSSSAPSGRVGHRARPPGASDELIETAALEATLPARRPRRARCVPVRCTVPRHRGSARSSCGGAAARSAVSAGSSSSTCAR